jgi:hypothetical protein
MWGSLGSAVAARGMDRGLSGVSHPKPRGEDNVTLKGLLPVVLACATWGGSGGTPR